MAIANLTEEFEKGQKGMASLRKIGKLIDEAIGEEACSCRLAPIGR